MQIPSAPWHGTAALVAGTTEVNTGIGRYVEMLDAGLQQAGVQTTRVAPTLPLLPDFTYRFLQWFGRDLRAFFTNYPLWSTYPEADIYHVTQQTLASLLIFSRPSGKVVVTVHDIFPYMVRNDPQLGSPYGGSENVYYRLPVAGLKRANHLIAVSEYTKRCVVKHLGISPEKISVVYNGIDHERFRPLTVPAAIREKYRLPPERRYLIYVGSEDPRKNLVALIGALAKVRKKLPNVELIKVGRAHFYRERRRLIDLANRLGVRTEIHFLEDVPEDHLSLLYNLAEVCVIPSLYEGFGFPVLEAMACGTPVVYADAGSLPEIAGNAGVPVSPCDVDTLTHTLLALLTRKQNQLLLRSAGQNQAARFTWAATTQSTVAVYRQLAPHYSCVGENPRRSIIANRT
jgi:glycosyltransferase involved in cell wall biosynthesis